jgi:hypothetical protein
LDLETTNGEVASEMISWYGGFIHPKRFRKIIDNLVILGAKAKHKIFICAGVKPTKKQAQLMTAYGIKIIQLPNKEHSSYWKKVLTARLGEEGVITSSTYSTLTKSASNFLPVTVMVADDLEGSNAREIWSFSMIKKFRENPEIGWIECE